MSHAVETLVEKLQALEAEFAAERGDFSLFAILPRGDTGDQWDLVVAAPWLEQDQREGLSYLAERVQSRLDTRELLALSGIFIIDEGHPLRAALKRLGRVGHDLVERHNVRVLDHKYDQIFLLANG